MKAFALLVHPERWIEVVSDRHQWVLCRDGSAAILMTADAFANINPRSYRLDQAPTAD